MILIVTNSMLAGILFYTACQFLFIGLRNRKYPQYLLFGFIVLLQAMNMLTELYVMLYKNSQAYLIDRNSYYLITAAINILFFFFISFVASYRHTFLKWSYFSLVLIALISNIAITSNALAIGSQPSWFWVIIADSIFWVTNIVQFIILSIFSLLAYQFQQTNKREHANFIVYSLLIFILGNIADLVINFGIIHYPVSVYFYLALIIYVNSILYRNIERARQFKDEAIAGEKKLRQIIDLVPNLIFAKDIEGRFILVNKAFADIYNRTPEDLIGLTHEDFFHIPQEIEFFRQKDLEVIKSGKPLLIPEESFTDKNGNLQILQTVKIPYTQNGSIAVLGVSTNNTDLKQAEKTLKDNEKLLETIFENAPVPLVLIGKKTEVLKINKASKELGLNSDKNFYGSQPGNALNCINATANEQGCGYGKECLSCALRSSIQTAFSDKRNINKIPYKMHVKNENVKTDYDILLSTSYLEINDEPLVLLVLEDITAIEKVERALMDSEYRYKQITRAITDYIYTLILHNNGEIQTIHTPACFAITGYLAEEFEADTSLWLNIIVDKDKEKVMNHIRNQSKSQENRYIEYQIIHKNGEERWISNTLVKKNKKSGINQYDGIIRDITQRKLTEIALDNQNKLLNTMLNNLPLGIFMVKVPDGVPLIANEQAKKLLGQGILPNTNLRNIADVYKVFKAGTNEPYPTEEMPINMGMRGEQAHIDDLEVEHPDGTRVLLEIVGCPVFDTNNKIWASLVGFYDITARKNAELALRESEKMLSITFEYSHVGISLSDYHGNLEYMNPAFCKLLNLQPDLIVENSFHLFAGYNEGDEEIELFDKLRKGELSMLNFERKFKKEPGKEIWVEMQVSCFRNVKGEVTNFIAVVEDITDRKNALDSLRASEEKFRNIFNTSNDAIIIADLESHVLEVNQIFMDRTGLTLQQLKNMRLIDIVFSTDHEEAEKLLKSVAENKAGFFQSSYVNQRGEKLYIEINGHSINYNGEQAALLISRDITERVISQQKMMNAIIEAEEKERSFFSQELHDGLGPILSTIKLYVEWIQNPDAKSDKSVLLTDALSTIEEAIVSVKEISNRLSPNVLKKFGLETAIQSFIKKIESLGKVHFEVNISLSKRIRPEIEAMLYRVFVEAINNSLKYANASNIVIKMNTNMKGLFASYNDDGIGFNVKDTLNQKSGHGLFNMQHRVEIYEGRFTLKSLPGKGTEIEIEIPSHKYILVN